MRALAFGSFAFYDVIIVRLLIFVVVVVVAVDHQHFLLPITLEYSSIYKLDMDIFIYSRIDESRINRRVTMIRKKQWWL